MGRVVSATALGLGIGLAYPRFTNASAAAYATMPAPAGFRWDFVTYLNARVTRQSVPVVALVEA